MIKTKNKHLPSYDKLSMKISNNFIDRSTCLEKLAYIVALHLHINSRRICCEPYEAETYFSLRVLRSTWKAAAIAGCGKSDEMEMEKKKTRIYLPRRA